MITSDKFLDGKLIIKQPRKGYRAGIDAVLLAAVVHPKLGDKILEIGAGVGTVMLCIAAHCPAANITGVEIQEDLVSICQENIKDNHFEDRINILQGDLSNPPVLLKPNTYDHVISNPPFHDYGPQAGNDIKTKSLSRHVSNVTLQDWIIGCLRFVKPRGLLTLIHRADQLDDSLNALRTISGGIKIYPFWPKQEKPAKLVILQARKGVKSACTIRPGMVLHDREGKYTQEAESIFRGSGRIEI